MTAHSVLIYTILAAAVATYFTRIAGYVLITRLSHIPPRLEAALSAVPAAVLSALVAPHFIYAGVDVTIALLVALAIGFRLPTLWLLLIAWAGVMGLRYFGV